MDGVLNVFKEKGMTSHDVVSKIRKIYRMKKVGHAGTLDPEVAGVLPILIGRATKLNNYLRGSKVYIGEVTLGIRTDTDDGSGNVLEQKRVPEMDEVKINQVFASFLGEQQQKPPVYSAKKIRGKKLYEYAREGNEPDIPYSTVYFHRLTALNIDIEHNKILFEAECSKGTYIRSFCRDIAEKLGTVGYMSYLIRTRSGTLCDIDQSIPLKFLERMSDRELEDVLISPEMALSDYPEVSVEESLRFALVNGRTVLLKLDELREELNYRVYAGAFIGLGKVVNKDGCQGLKMELLLDGR